jgi:hypothetical protein
MSHTGSIPFMVIILIQTLKDNKKHEDFTVRPGIQQKWYFDYDTRTGLIDYKLRKNQE